MRRLAQPFLIFFCIGGLQAQTCLVLAPAAATSGDTVSLHLYLYSASSAPPAALQWTLQYPASSITRITVDDGPALDAAAKTTFCAADTTGYKCLAAAANLNTIGNGIVAKITAVLAAGITSATLHLTDTLGASPDGQAIPILSRDAAFNRTATDPTPHFAPKQELVRRWCSVQ